MCVCAVAEPELWRGAALHVDITRTIAQNPGRLERLAVRDGLVVRACMLCQALFVLDGICKCSGFVGWGSGGGGSCGYHARGLEYSGLVFKRDSALLIIDFDRCR